MKREIIETADGSKTIYLPELLENYHSGNGAYQEAMHVFIENGIKSMTNETLSIFEMGFGTGLNALLALSEASCSGRKMDYTGIEAFPVAQELAFQMDYEQFVDERSGNHFREMHQLEWGEKYEIDPLFSFRKLHEKIEDYLPEFDSYDLIFFDAFGPRAQAEVWEMPVLEKMKAILKPGGILVTYCAKGQFKRDLKSLGFEVKSLPGPPGKREMTQAIK
jgi:tRNA U34 5-methylaminomethyl-2-thiouridine-forming methyltransferase MnmC